MTELLVIDVGSRRISAAVAIINEDGQIDVTGLGCVRSSGLKQGVIIQIDSVVDAFMINNLRSRSLSFCLDNFIQLI